MITMEMYGKVRRMFLRERLSINEIKRRTRLSRNTIKKWLAQPEGIEPKYRRQETSGKLAAYETQLTQALEADSRRPKRERRTALKLFGQLQQAGFSGSYPLVTDFVRQWREASGKGISKTAYVPLQFELGEAFQFDWSEEGMVIGGIYQRLQVAHMKLCASRAFWLVAYPSQGHEMLFDAHTRAFSALGGVARRGIYDNMKTAVDKVKKGKGRVVNARFAALTAHYLFDPDFCNVASGWEKGIVEKNVQDSRRRIWQDASQQRFSSLTELNAWLANRCRALWNELPHSAYPGLSIADVLEQEQTELMPMPSSFDGYVENPARVSSTCLVNVKVNHYSVPCEWVGQIVSIRLYPERINVVANEKLIASHARCFARGKTRYNWLHYIPLLERKPGALRNGAPFADMPEPLLQLQRALLRREGGDRVMAQVLAVVPTFGLEAVLVAAELVLESGLPSAEHVLNVLARLKAQALPEPVETALPVKDEPLADTGRYDHLLETEADHG